MRKKRQRKPKMVLKSKKRKLKSGNPNGNKWKKTLKNSKDYKKIK
jgi:hypothetical protein